MRTPGSSGDLKRRPKRREASGLAAVPHGSADHRQRPLGCGEGSSLRGKSLAKVQGRMIAELCENAGTAWLGTESMTQLSQLFCFIRMRIDVIITSPYIRCVQTAVAVSEVLPSKKGTQALRSTPLRFSG